MTDRATSKRAQDCGPHAAVHPYVSEVSDLAFERAAALFRAAGDLARLRLLHRLDAGECCVTELAEASETKLSTLSQQLRVLHAERIVKRRREGKHIFYSLADDHVRELIRAALDHAGEPAVVTAPDQGKKKKS
jgi:DNA-binding transcriptional ArsR family regulator